MTTLSEKRCLPCEGGVPALDKDSANKLREHLHEDWSINDSNTEIIRDIGFKDYYETMAFVNALAWMAHQENHHPDLEVSYNHCKVHYSTHAIGGLSENDFVCAAKADALLGS